MLNQIVMVGRLVCNPELKETDDGKKVATITLAIPRSYKNAKGEYDTDFIDCVLWAGMAENTIDYCKKGDLLGIKGRVQSTDVEEKDKAHRLIEIVAEKVTFLSSKKQED